MMSFLALSYRFLAAGGSWERSMSEAASSGGGAGCSGEPCRRDAVSPLPALTDCHPFPSCPGSSPGR